MDRHYSPHSAGTPFFRRPHLFLLFSLFVLLSACGEAPTPTAPQTVGPGMAGTATTQPTVLPPMQTFTPAADLTAMPGVGQFVLTFYNLVLDYNPAHWQVVPGSAQDQALSNVEISNCVIREQGPTEPPSLAARVTLGQVVYQQSDEIPLGNGIVERWYLAQGGTATPTPAGIPILRVSAPEDNKINCFEAAEEVLATLHPAGR